jgi:hypothetical protein
MSDPRINGYCPACGQPELVMNYATANLRCLGNGCPNPDAAHQLLAQNRTGHVVEITADGYTLRHPTLERIGDRLFECQATAWMSQLIRNTEPEPGVYRMTGGGENWVLTAVTD